MTVIFLTSHRRNGRIVYAGANNVRERPPVKKTHKPYKPRKKGAKK